MFLRRDLDELLGNEARPAISLYLPTHLAGRETRQSAVRLKNLIASAAERLPGEWRHSEAAALLAPANSLVEDEDFWRHPEVGVAIFVAPGFSRVHKLPLAVAEKAVIGNSFHIRPLLPILDDAGPFRLLAITAKHARLYQGSRWSFGEIEGTDLPQGVASVAGSTRYEETRSSAPTGRGSAGFAQVQSLGETPEELRKTELIELLHRIARQVEPYIGATPMPLILAGQPEIEGHFREIASWRELQPGAVAENPDAMTPDELHRRGYAVIAKKCMAARTEALDRLNALLGAGDTKATTRPDEIVKAARHSRVDTLFVGGDEHLWGTFDEARDRIVVYGKAARDNVDLLDDAAVMTLRHGGAVVSIEPSALPPAARIAAILRY